MAKRRRRVRPKGVPKRWSTHMVHGGPGPNPVVLAEYKERTKSLRMNAWAYFFFAGSNQTPPERLKVIKRLEQIMNDVPPERNILIFNSGLRSIRLFFNQTCDCWFFMERNRHRVRTSITYLTKARAMECYNLKKIIWIGTVSTMISSSSSDPSAEPPG